MKIKVTYFGKLIELTGMSSEDIVIEEASVSGVKKALEHTYPSLKTITYQLAENNAILKQGDAIHTTEVDIFPPFSGG